MPFDYKTTEDDVTNHGPDLAHHGEASVQGARTVTANRIPHRATYRIIRKGRIANLKQHIAMRGEENAQQAVYDAGAITQGTYSSVLLVSTRAIFVKSRDILRTYA